MWNTHRVTIKSILPFMQDLLNCKPNRKARQKCQATLLVVSYFVSIFTLSAIWYLLFLVPFTFPSVAIFIMHSPQITNLSTLLLNSISRCYHSVVWKGAIINGSVIIVDIINFCGIIVSLYKVSFFIYLV